MPELSADFYFTQLRFHDFLECKRRFQLRYLLEQPWPANVSEPAEDFEQQIENGRQFHRLVHQYLLGMPVAVLSNMADNPPLSIWWAGFLEHGLNEVPPVRIPEVSRSTSLGGHALIGKFDLIAAGEDRRVLIVDWKTGSPTKSLGVLRARMQSRVYPYILAREGLDLPGLEHISPAQIHMRYWFAEDPSSPVEFEYSDVRFAEDDDFMARLVAEIEALGAEDFDLTQDEQACKGCPYRSLCGRGVRAGRDVDAELDVDTVGDWDGDEGEDAGFAPPSLLMLS